MSSAYDLEFCVKCKDKFDIEKTITHCLDCFKHIHPVNEWISVKDKLPDHQQFFLGTSIGGRMQVLRCDIHSNGTKLIDYVFMNADLTHQITGVTHWMPLPDEPK